MSDDFHERAVRELDATRAIVEALRDLDPAHRARAIAAAAILHGIVPPDSVLAELHNRPATPCVHILDGGLPLCAFTMSVPGEWPAGHTWTRTTERHRATCPGCVEVARRR